MARRRRANAGSAADELPTVRPPLGAPSRGKRETSPINPQCGKTGRKTCDQREDAEWGRRRVCKQEGVRGQSSCVATCGHPTTERDDQRHPDPGEEIHCLGEQSEDQLRPGRGAGRAGDGTSPPWKRNDAQPWVAFQMITGLNTMSTRRRHRCQVRTGMRARRRQQYRLGCQHQIKGGADREKNAVILAQQRATPEPDRPRPKAGDDGSVHHRYGRIRAATLIPFDAEQPERRAMVRREAAECGRRGQAVITV